MIVATDASKTAVWIAPAATGYSCLCEPCLERARSEGTSLLEAVREANVRGTLALDADVGFARCPSGHQIVVRRVGRTRGRARGSGQLRLPSLTGALSA